MKKALLLMFFVAAAGSARANGKFDMLCITEIPTTTFAFRENGDKILVQVLHHNGVEYMPIYDSTLTPSDLPAQEENAKTLMSLGQTLSFEWPKEKCAHQDRFLQSCFGTLPEQKVAGHVVKAWSVYTSQETSKSFAGQFHLTRVSMALDVDGKTYNIPMKYSDGDCVDDATQIEKKRQILRVTHPEF